ncbi:MAG: hypothetical protein ACQEQ1_01585 [Pseudomonadota bacterium]
MKAFSYLYCLVNPLGLDNIIFLSKQRKTVFAVWAIGWRLRLLHHLSIEDVAELDRSENPFETDVFKVMLGLPDKIVDSLMCLGFIKVAGLVRLAKRYGVEVSRNIREDSPLLNNDIYPDPALVEVITGKSVALVGPSKGENNQDEIENYDFVVRIGYSGIDSLPEGSGDRCDISFYEPHKIVGLIRQDKVDVLDDVGYLFLFNTSQLQDEGLSIDEFFHNRDGWRDIASPSFYATNPNALVKVLYHCIIAGASDIKVFNADLFLSASYPAGYIANKKTVSHGQGWSYEGKRMCRSFALHHDPGEQHLFYRFFYREKCFRADARLDQIINKSTPRYLEELDTQYGKPVREELGMSVKGSPT